MTSATRIVKTAFIFTTLALSTQSFAQGMSDADMQSMMEKANEAQACFEKIDPSTFKDLETKGKAMERELKQLCEAGKRGEAMRKAMKYVKEFESSPEIREVKRCASIMEGMMGSLPIPDIEQELKDKEDGHICDDI